jgi:hypothetical protein
MDEAEVKILNIFLEIFLPTIIPIAAAVTGGGIIPGIGAIILCVVNAFVVASINFWA